MWGRSAPCWGLLLLVIGLGGCAGALPRGHSDTPSQFETFEAAQQAASRIVPLKTRTDELAALGFDPRQGPNVTLIPYPDIAARLAPHPGVPISALDEGVRACLEAQSACRGYLFRFHREDRRREGSFWLDFLNFRRTTAITGWWFEALIVVADGTVLFRNMGGQAHIDRTERETNPLGPLQSSGEAAAREGLR